jgi:hypothetical protein
VRLACSRRKDGDHALIAERGDYRSIEKLRKGYTTAVKKKRSIKHAAGVDVTVQHDFMPSKKQVCVPPASLACARECRRCDAVSI